MRCSRLLIVCLAASISAYGQELATIRVTILSERDEPVRDAIAEAMPIDRAQVGVLPSCKSDQNGTCIIKVDYGKFGVAASKVENGYPEQHFSFYASQNPRPPVVALSPEQPFQSVTVHLGKKAGVLTGTVSDAITGKPLNANVTFQSPSDRSIFLSGSGLTNAKFRILVPSDTPITMVVSQNSYEDWTYSLGRSEFRNAILLKAGEELTLDIRMQPKR